MAYFMENKTVRYADTHPPQTVFRCPMVNLPPFWKSPESKVFISLVGNSPESLFIFTLKQLQGINKI